MRPELPSHEAIRLYRNLADFMSFLIEEGALDESDLGDNFTVVRNITMRIAGADPGNERLPGHIIGEFGYEPCDECGEPADDGEGWNGLCGNCADKADEAP